MRLLKHSIPYLCIAVSAIVTGCSNGNSRQPDPNSGDTLTVNARLLVMVDHDRYVTAEVTDPWDTTRIMARYIMIPRGHSREGIPDNGTILETPLSSSIVYSGVHAHAIAEIGALEAITGVADGGYFTMPEILARLASGKISDIGSSLSPSLEKLIDIAPQAILISPYQNAGHGIIDQSGAAVIEMADYMEPTPLGRAEWIRFIGELYGNRTTADSIYESVCDRYNSLSQHTKSISDSPSVVTQMIQSGVWYVPGGNSYQARMLADAGAFYPWHDDTSAGSLPLDFAAVFDKAHDADYWLTSTYGPDLTLEEMKRSYPLNAKMKAFRTGGVYNVNSSESAFYDEFPFHPDLLLSDYINIFHPGLLDNQELRYYRQVQ